MSIFVLLYIMLSFLGLHLLEFFFFCALIFFFLIIIDIIIITFFTKKKKNRETSRLWIFVINNY